MQAVIRVNPFRCRAWSMHTRLDEHLTEESCDAEIRSFEQRGQLVAALGRRSPKGADYDIEIICGTRRLFAARHLNEPLLVEVRELTDREAAIALEIENGQRSDISAYERGVGFARWLREGYFTSQDEIAAELQVSRSQVSRLLKLANLPSAVLAAFGSGLEICEAWGVVLASALEDPQRRRSLLQAASSLAAISPRPPAREVYKQLCAAAGDRSNGQADSSRVVRGPNGLPLFEIKRQGSSILLVLPIAHVSAKSLEAIEESMTLIMCPYVRRPAAAGGLHLHDAIA